MIFPRNEAEVLTLSMELLSGLDANTDVYPAPPVATPELGSLIGAYTTARNAVVAAQAAADEAYTAKQDALDALIDGMKTDIRYCENTVSYDDDKLKLIGWGGRRARAGCWRPRARARAGSFWTGRPRPTAVSPAPTR